MLQLSGRDDLYNVFVFDTGDLDAYLSSYSFVDNIGTLAFSTSLDDMARGLGLEDDIRINTNDVVVGNVSNIAREGFLGRVTSIDNDTLKFEPASIDDAIEDGDLDETIDLLIDDIDRNDLDQALSLLAQARNMLYDNGNEGTEMWAAIDALLSQVYDDLVE